MKYTNNNDNISEILKVNIIRINDYTRGRNISAHSFNPYAYFGHSWSYFYIQNLRLAMLYIFRKVLTWLTLWSKQNIKYLCTRHGTGKKSPTSITCLPIPKHYRNMLYFWDRIRMFCIYWSVVYVLPARLCFFSFIWQTWNIKRKCKILY